MTKLYKKGSVVPKYLMRTLDKKQQHVLKFGCDVLVDNRRLVPQTEGSIFVVPYVTHTTHKRKGCRGRAVRKWKNVVMDTPVHMDCKGLPFRTTGVTVEGPGHFTVVDVHDSRVPKTIGSCSVYDNL
ncbi:hypothetical protein NVP1244A_116 [Vibrio phage 1.244.A._10N.261.54.C3]|nr:hypothetical protein NVP1244A_116 [Vibrio phage 1.244.A._10N.261.54.C3]AUR98744.1 hypothetical protein NVP1255O_116 [Vibrio phage 1.255.O._10N.286.45.F1]